MYSVWVVYVEVYTRREETIKSIFVYLCMNHGTLEGTTWSTILASRPMLSILSGSIGWSYIIIYTTLPLPSTAGTNGLRLSKPSTMRFAATLTVLSAHILSGSSVLAIPVPRRELEEEVLERMPNNPPPARGSRWEASNYLLHDTMYLPVLSSVAEDNVPINFSGSVYAYIQEGNGCWSKYTGPTLSTYPISNPTQLVNPVVIGVAHPVLGGRYLSRHSKPIRVPEYSRRGSVRSIAYPTSTTKSPIKPSSFVTPAPTYTHPSNNYRYNARIGERTYLDHQPSYFAASQSRSVRLVVCKCLSPVTSWRSMVGKGGAMERESEMAQKKGLDVAPEERRR
ncbi:hypothetical protein DFP72DRAFT_852014 [Ephemerocybe angulata]|uniref:Uncharacterized protein n=1 Tax=Ephemerocybe angulata TaxID=980116 RepID=A0A8H6HPM6_9AGAR|nr:hypothetical protein DFP72DRAFT_852014 [Tulosesus angulatus]